MNQTALSPAALRRTWLALGAAVFAITCLLLLALPGQAQDPQLPPAPPNSLSGLETFEGRCANCHGVAGQGDGELVAQLPAPPRPFDATYIRTALPSAMYNQITNGNLNVGMPPFGPASQNPIDEQGRWDLVTAVYILATEPKSVEEGERIYQQNCAACHGVNGQGDGPESTAAEPATDLTALDYWFNRSNETVLTALAPGAFAAHDYTLSEAELVSVVDFSRTFSYSYVDPAVLFAPIPAGVIRGTVTNGTTGEVVPSGEVVLRAFTPDFNETLTLTTTVGTDGAFRFNVNDVPPDWIFIAGAPYDELNFSSAANQLDRATPELDLPITVYEKSADASAVNIAQLHTVLQFAGDRVEVSELYIVNNDQNRVFMGATGNPDEGVFEVGLPAGAENLSFQRSFGSMDSFIPANDFIQTERGWADPQALGPGAGALTLLVRYDLPYSSGMSIAHPVFYNAASSTIILPDAGVEVSNADWIAQEPQNFGQGETFLNYSRAPISAGEPLTIELEGRPRLVTDTSGQTVVNRDQTTELIIGGTALLLVAGAGVYFWRASQARQAAEDDEAYVAAVSAAAGADTADSLLRQIADLDAAYEAGQVAEDNYRESRAALKSRLAAVWNR
jgi:mono/diheme cytochrome c family protein